MSTWLLIVAVPATACVHTIMIQSSYMQLSSCFWSCRRSALTLAAGAIHRAKGGMAMRAAVGFTVDTMLAVAASVSNASLHKWLAHSLLLIANAAGPSYVPYVQVTPRCRAWRSAAGAAPALTHTYISSRTCPPSFSTRRYVCGCIYFRGR